MNNKKLKHWKLLIGILLLGICIANEIIRFSILIRIRLINQITTVIENNLINLILIGVALLIIYAIDRKRYIESLTTLTLEEQRDE